MYYCIIIMAKNTGNGTRMGPISNRSQTYNPKTNLYVKKDESGKFLACKDTPFKNVRRDQTAKDQETKNKETKSK